MSPRLFISTKSAAEGMCDFHQRTSGWQPIDWLKKWAGELIKGSGYDLIDSDKYVSDHFQSESWHKAQDLLLW